MMARYAICARYDGRQALQRLREDRQPMIDALGLDFAHGI